MLNAVTFWVLNYVNLFTNNLKDNKNVAKLLLGDVGSGFCCIQSWSRRFRVPTAMAIWFSGALGRMPKGRELRSNVATWLRPEAFKIRPNGSRLWFCCGWRLVSDGAGRCDFPASQSRVTKSFQLLLVFLKVGNLVQGKREQW